MIGQHLKNFKYIFLLHFFSVFLDFAGFCYNIHNISSIFLHFYDFPIFTTTAVLCIFLVKLIEY